MGRIRGRRSLLASLLFMSLAAATILISVSATTESDAQETPHKGHHGLNHGHRGQRGHHHNTKQGADHIQMKKEEAVSTKEDSLKTSEISDSFTTSEISDSFKTSEIQTHSATEVDTQFAASAASASEPVATASAYPCTPPPALYVNHSLGLAEIPKLLNASTHNPKSRYLTAGLTFHPTTGTPAWSFLKSVDWSYLLPAPEDQDAHGMCRSCWSFAVSAAIQAAYAIQGGQEKAAVEPSQQQFLDCGKAGTCGAGGYPEDALQYAANPGEPAVVAAHVYSYTGPDGGTCRAQDFHFAPSSKISMFEQTAFAGPLALMLAVQHQPVVVNIRASPSFQAYPGGIYDDPTCFDENTIGLDHTVLVTGYHFEGFGPSSCVKNYFIIRNSWGTTWGENGYMRMAIVFTSFGICGITSTLGMYPVIEPTTFKRPCNFSVCGGGACTNADSASIGASTTAPVLSSYVDNRCQPPPPPPPSPPYTCNCSGNLALTTNLDGTQTCVSKEQCGLFQFNPCGQGTCVNTGNGTYSCICPPGFKLDKKTGSATCLPAANPVNLDTYVTQQGDTCYLIYTVYSLSEKEFQDQNLGLDCSASLPAGRTVNVTHTRTCAIRYPISPADTCDSIHNKFETNLTELNPGLAPNCSHLHPGQQICVLGGDPAGLHGTQVCTEYAQVSFDTTCASIKATHNISYGTLYSLNPGLLCDNLNALGGQQICVGGFPLSSFHCPPNTKPFYVTSEDTCTSLVVQKYRKNKELMKRCNNNWTCSATSLLTMPTLCALPRDLKC